MIIKKNFLFSTQNEIILTLYVMKHGFLTPSDLLNREIKGKYYLVGEHFNRSLSELKKARLTSEVEYMEFKHIIF